jgi:hypothetical protein
MPDCPIASPQAAKIFVGNKQGVNTTEEFMPQRLTVLPPSTSEEKRLWAEAFAKLHYAISLMDERAAEFFPGEHVEDFRAAWRQTGNYLEKIVQSLNQQNAPENITDKQMADAAFTGPQGALKLKIFTKEGEEFLAYAVSEPHTEEKTRRAARAGSRLADMGAAATQSLKAVLSEFPGMRTACEATGEGLEGIKHLLDWRSRRRH